MMTYLLTFLYLVSSAAMYRLRGSGLLNGLGWPLWGLFTGFAVLVFTHCWMLAGAVGFGAFAGKWISHGVVYRLDKRCAGAWFSICFLRGSFLVAPFMFPYWFPLCLFTAAGGLAANYVSRKGQDYRMNDDMLKWAEPLQGLVFATTIVVAVYA